MIEIDPKLAAAFENQIAVELGNAIAYLSAYSALRALGWEGFSKKMKNEAFDEFGHAQNFTKYLARRGMAWEAKEIVAPEAAESNPAALAELAYNLEAATESVMRDLVTAAQDAKDESAVEYVAGKLVEQEKMTKQTWDFSQRVKDAAGEIGALVILDRQIENKGW